MISSLSVPLALAVPTLEGWLLVRVIEGKNPVLSPVERLCIGHLLGIAGSAFVIFWAVLAGVPLTLLGFAVVHTVLIVALLGICRVRNPKSQAPNPKEIPSTKSQFPKRRLEFEVWNLKVCWDLGFGIWDFVWGSRPSPRWIRLLLIILLVWTFFKIAAGSYDLLLTPSSYFNDVYANWNMRSKAFFVHESLLLDLPKGDLMYFGGRVPSYPLTVYFTKVWLAQTAGTFTDPIVNSVHVVWFLVLIGLVFEALRRTVSVAAAAIGVYVLVSLPLVLLHGVNPYADVLMGAYVFSALYLLSRWVEKPPNLKSQNSTLLILCGCMTAALIFVKNEGLLIYLPSIAFLIGAVAWRRERALRPWLRSISPFFNIVVPVAASWVLLKISLGLTFGNAQSVGGIPIEYHAGVPGAIFHGLFHAGSFLLLFPLLLLLIALTPRSLIRSSIGLLIAFCAIVLFGQVIIFAFTPLAVEALRQTGFSRGVLQVSPLLVFIGVVLGRRLFYPCTT